MASPMRIRAKMEGDVAVVRVIMGHEMESGARRGSDGKMVPAHFIQNVTASLNGAAVVEGQWSGAVSKNPYFGFKVKGAKAGDEITVAWKDNKGESRTDKAKVTA